MAQPNDDLWIFGYGSIVWKVDFPVTESVCGYIKGWYRRFWQGSPDHRGVPGALGRVVTLIPENQIKSFADNNEVNISLEEPITWGKVFCVPSTHVEEVLKHLDHREKAGYERSNVEVHCVDGTLRSALVFIATPENDDFLGPAPMDEMILQIATSVGPSGTNREYFERIVKSIREMQVDDPHLESLATSLKQLDENKTC